MNTVCQHIAHELRRLLRLCITSSTTPILTRTYPLLLLMLSPGLRVVHAERERDPTQPRGPYARVDSTDQQSADGRQLAVDAEAASSAPSGPGAAANVVAASDHVWQVVDIEIT